MNHIKFSKWTLLIVAASTLLFNCSKKKDDPAPAPVEVPAPAPQTITYNFNGDVGLGGTVTFTELNSTQTRVDISVTGLASGTHPSHIHEKSAADTGAVVIPLANVDENGKSTKIVDVAYANLVNFDGYINVHSSTSDNTVIAQTDIGGNALTGNMKTYPIMAETGKAVTGSVTFKERKNGNTLAIVNLLGVSAGQYFEVVLLTGNSTSVSNALPDVILKKVDGQKRVQQTNIRYLQGTTTPLLYTNIVGQPRYIKVTLSGDLTPSAKGNIGTSYVGS